MVVNGQIQPETLHHSYFQGIPGFCASAVCSWLEVVLQIGSIRSHAGQELNFVFQSFTVQGCAVVG